MLNLLHLVVLSASVAPPVDFFLEKFHLGLRKIFTIGDPYLIMKKKSEKKSIGGPLPKT